MPAKASPDHAAALAAEIREYCARNADPKQAGKWARYFREGYDDWGGFDKGHPLWHAVQQDWFERYRSLGAAGFVRLGALLFHGGKYEEGATAIQLLKRVRGELDAHHVASLAAWFDNGIANWAHADVLCGEVLGPVLAAGQAPLETLAPWRESQWKYQRRAVPVAMISLVKAGAAVPPLLEFIRPMMLDAERVVHQGLGWLLREAWKTQPKPVEKFLLEFKDRSARLIFQYATEKMTPAARERFRAAKRKKD